MEQPAEQTQQESTAIHSPSDWASKLRESSKPAEQEEQADAPQEEEAELEVSEEPTSDEDQEIDSEEEEELDDAGDEPEETESSDESPSDNSIVADGTYTIDGQEVDGQKILNGIAATDNFAQEKHRLRVEAQETLAVDRGELQKQKDEYAAGVNFMLGINQQAQQQYNNVNWVELQMNNPAEYQKQKESYGQLVSAQQQLKGQFDAFLTRVKSDQTESQRKSAENSLVILRESHGGEAGWAKRYPELRGIASKYGFKADEFNNFTDYRLMAVFDELDKSKARLSDIEKSTAKKISNPVKEKRRRNSQRTNTTNSRRTTEAHDNFMKTRKPKDAAMMLMQAQKKRG